MLAVVIPYHNPLKWKSRLINYNLCRELLEKQGAKVFTVECGYRGEYQTNAEIITNTKHILWQKEKNLNYAFTHIPEQYDHLAWIDGDFLFADNDWVAKTEYLLQEFDYVQLFDTVANLRAGHRDREPNQVDSTSPGIVDNPSANMNPGGAWAARRNRIHLYDKHITGGGDALTYQLLCQGNVGLGISYFEYVSRALRRDMCQFGNTFLSDCGNLSVSYLPQTAYHLYHGSVIDRDYSNRHRMLVDFDPDTDIRDVGGAWEWNSDLPELHLAMHKHFLIRQEDLWI